MTINVVTNLITVRRLVQACSPLLLGVLNVLIFVDSWESPCHQFFFFLPLTWKWLSSSHLFHCSSPLSHFSHPSCSPPTPGPTLSRRYLLFPLSMEIYASLWWFSMLSRLSGFVNFRLVMIYVIPIIHLWVSICHRYYSFLSLWVAESWDFVCAS